MVLWSISTHTPLARRDIKLISSSVSDSISTHTPLARRDAELLPVIIFYLPFLLTRLSQGVTINPNDSSNANPFLLTRLSQGVTATSCPSRYCITQNTRSGHKASILTPLYFTTIRQIFQRTFPLFSNHCTFAVTVQEISELLPFACPYHIIITPSGS